MEKKGSHDRDFSWFLCKYSLARVISGQCRYFGKGKSGHVVFMVLF